MANCGGSCFHAAGTLEAGVDSTSAETPADSGSPPLDAHLDGPSDSTAESR